MSVKRVGMTAVPAERLLLDPATAAAVLSIDRSTLYELLRDGQIESIRIGRARRIPVAALQRWVNTQVEAQRAS